MKTNELMIKQERELSEQQIKFVKTHEKILSAGSMITNSVISLAKNLKIMRDEKLYLEADCQSFEEYAEEICGLKKSQAYSYIQVLEKLGEDFFQSTGKIGITKLTLLANLPEEERTEIIESVDIEDVSVSKLKEEIKQLKKELEQKEEDISEFDLKSVEIENLNAEIVKLNKQIKELENKPAEVVTKVEVDEKSKEQVKELKEKLKNMTEQFKAAEEQYKISSGQAAELRKQISLNSDTSMIEFKMKFENLQSIVQDLQQLLGQVPEDKQEGCRQALKKVGEMLC